MSRLTLDDDVNMRVLKESLNNKVIDKNVMNILSEDYKNYRFISFDVETQGRNNDFYMCGVINEDGEYKAYYNKDDVIKYFMNLKHGDVVVVATNLGFDYSALFKDTDYFNLSNFVVNKGRYIMITLTGKYANTKFLDTLNYGSMSVKAMGEVLGLPKVYHPCFLGKKPKNKKQRKILEDYNRRDCEITRNFMILLQEVVNGIGGELKPTISSTALDIYRRKFMKYPLIREFYCSGGLNVKDKIYEAYYGGRTEVYKRGLIESKGNDIWRYYDVVNLYGYCMLKEYPVPQSVKYEHNQNFNLLRFLGVSKFKVVVPKMRYPPLPYRKDGKLIFPYGTLVGYWTHEEILYAESLGCKILKMSDTVYYEKKDTLFKDYIMYMYRKRHEEKLKEKQTGKTSLSVFYKLLNNSLYGKFATKSIDNTDFFIADSDETVNRKIDEAGQGASFNINMNDVSYYSNSHDFDGIYSMPILSCYVTSYARIHIHKYILQLEPVYVDTDSCITLKETVDSSALGEMKLEKVIKKGIIIKPKMYFLDDAIKVKGVHIPKGEDKVEDMLKIERIKKNLLANKPVHYEKFVKMKEGG